MIKELLKFHFVIILGSISLDNSHDIVQEVFRLSLIQIPIPVDIMMNPHLVKIHFESAVVVFEQLFEALDMVLYGTLSLCTSFRTMQHFVQVVWTIKVWSTIGWRLKYIFIFAHSIYDLINVYDFLNLNDLFDRNLLDNLHIFYDFDWDLLNDINIYFFLYGNLFNNFFDLNNWLLCLINLFNFLFSVIGFQFLV